MERLDQYLIAKGFMPSRDSAQEDIKAGQVLVNGKTCLKPGYKVKDTDVVEYLGQGRQFVSRGAAKLLGAIELYDLDFKDKTCIDVGASTGGFTQLMLAKGARSVAALDVGHDQLDPSLRGDSRITEYSGVNFRAIPDELSGVLRDFDFLTMDVSFISVCLLADSVKQVLKPGAGAVILIKPQFEAGRGKLNKNGVLKDFSKHVEVLDKVLACYAGAGFQINGLSHSPLQGPEGNIEYLLYLTKDRISKTETKPKIDQTEQETAVSKTGSPAGPVKLEGISKRIVETAFQAFSFQIRG